MKIETTKTFTPSKNTFAKQNAGGSSNNTEGANEIDKTDLDSSEFARVLDNLSSKEKNAASNNSVKSKEREDKDDAKTREKQSSEDDERSEKSKNSSSREDASAGANARMMSNENFYLDNETSLPPARSILHIADLERIVSSVRTNAFEGQNQVVITLKNSVFSGLQIKLTADENRRVTAEFIAANEKVKAQIDARSGELADLLKRRGINLAGLQTTVGAETSSGDNNQQSNNAFGNTASLPSNLINKESSEADQTLETTELEGHIYRV